MRGACRVTRLWSQISCSGASHLQLREARGRVGVQLELGRAGGGRVLSPAVEAAERSGQHLRFVRLNFQHLLVQSGGR